MSSFSFRSDVTEPRTGSSSQSPVSDPVYLYLNRKQCTPVHIFACVGCSPFHKKWRVACTMINGLLHILYPRQRCTNSPLCQGSTAGNA